MSMLYLQMEYNQFLHLKLFKEQVSNLNLKIFDAIYDQRKDKYVSNETTPDAGVIRMILKEARIDLIERKRAAEISELTDKRLLREYNHAEYKMPWPPRVFYNRLPKCGSTTLLRLMTVLSRYNNFTLEKSVQWTDSLDEGKQMWLVDKFSKFTIPFLFERHTYFVNFTRFNQPMPVYINLVRDPLERLASLYYFKRNTGLLNVYYTDEQRNRTFEECIVDNDPECMGHNETHTLVSYFCGHDSLCSLKSREALHQAMRNIVNHYAVIGLMEDYRRSLRLFEQILPFYFTGVTALYDALSEYHEFENSHELPGENTRSTILDKLSLEYELFRFIKQRFYYAQERLGLS
ncbi:unnamed protein product [Owenia fusiformis]|uniref:Uncharacterized protein n=1 Tax=Owenia fusiformis TaxID=6347 RepID=A0A8S4PVH5_OWEFU|nr:unnamed protein product [Owenia fusiformis]